MIPFLIGITGGSGSGKTYLSNKIFRDFGAETITIIQMDSYYKDLKHLTMEEREKNNFDHPNAFDFKLLNNHLEILFSKKNVNIPIYDYKTHTRMLETKEIRITPIILIEGIFALHNEHLRNSMHLKVFIDTPDIIRKKRRIDRDKKNRARDLNSILTQYKKTVTPMFKEYIKPMKDIADLVISENKKKDADINKLFKYINSNL
jgi:uridine kinase